MKVIRKRYLMLFILLLPLVMPLLTGEWGLPRRVHKFDSKGPILRSDLPDFSAISDLKKKKRRFFEFVSPVIEAENARIFEKRQKLLELYDQHRQGMIFSIEEKQWLEYLKKKYRVYDDSSNPEAVWMELIKRVDVLPVELALIQAAKESGWGTSRFARMGNNIFGQWCFIEGCGIVPINREEGATHEVQKFASVNESVRSYMRNLNTHFAYEEFRELRYKQRLTGEGLKGYPLVSGLPGYSERGEAYLEEIRDMMMANMDIIGSL
jgi:Bax protein